MDIRASRLAKLAIHAANDERARIIYSREGMNWQHGLCLVFAAALRKVADHGRLYALAVDMGEGCKPTMSHVVLYAYGRCFDSLGGASVKTAVRRSDKYLATCGMSCGSIFVPLKDTVHFGAVDYDYELLAEVMEKIAAERGIDVRNAGNTVGSPV
jgi:hypothetical protein